MTKPSSEDTSRPSGAVVTTVQQPKNLPNKCGFCKQPLGVCPPITIPLGPVQWVVDEKAAAAKLEIKNGYVNEISACIVCAQIYLSTCRNNGEEIVRQPPAEIKAKGFFFPRMQCQTCEAKFLFKENVDFLFCPGCGAGHKVKKD